MEVKKTSMPYLYLYRVVLFRATWFCNTLVKEGTIDSPGYGGWGKMMAPKTIPSLSHFEF